MVHGTEAPLPQFAVELERGVPEDLSLHLLHRCRNFAVKGVRGVAVRRVAIRGHRLPVVAVGGVVLVLGPMGGHPRS